MSKQSIVLIEVNPDDQLLITRAVSQLRNHVDITAINSLAKAPASLFESRVKPDLILIDLHHGKSFDPEHIYRLRSKPSLKNTPILLVADRFSERVLNLAYAASIQSCIRKTEHSTAWNRSVRNVVNYWLNIHTSEKAS